MANCGNVKFQLWIGIVHFFCAFISSGYLDPELIFRCLLTEAGTVTLRKQCLGSPVFLQTALSWHGSVAEPYWFGLTLLTAARLVKRKGKVCYLLTSMTDAIRFPCGEKEKPCKY